MRQPLDYIPVKTVEHLEKLKDFAKTFDHDICNYRHEATEIRKGDQTVGYWQMYFVPTAFVAFHPEHCEPRDTLDAIKALSSWAKIQHQQGWVAVNFDSKVFTPELMEKLGFHRMNTELYSI